MRKLINISAGVNTMPPKRTFPRDPTMANFVRTHGGPGQDITQSRRVYDTDYTHSFRYPTDAEAVTFVRRHPNPHAGPPSALRAFRNSFGEVPEFGTPRYVGPNGHGYYQWNGPGNYVESMSLSRTGPRRQKDAAEAVAGTLYRKANRKTQALKKSSNPLERLSAAGRTIGITDEERINAVASSIPMLINPRTLSQGSLDHISARMNGLHIHNTYATYPPWP